MRMLVSVAMAALSYLGVKGNLGKAVKIAQAMRPTGMAPAMLGAGGRAGPTAPVRTTAMMMTEQGEAGAASAEGTSLRGPARWHWAATVKQNTLAKNLNTVIEPGVDVAGDVAEIHAGKAARVGGNHVVNGRKYGVHDGTLYPISGPGFHPLTRGAFQALGVFNKFGDTPQAHAILGKMKNVGPAEVKAALKAWSTSR